MGQMSDSSKEDAQNKCLQIFMHLSKYNKEDNTFYIYQQAILTLFRQIGVVSDQLIKISEIDLLFKKVNPNSKRYTSKQFLDLISHTAHRIDSDIFNKNPKAFVLFIIKKFFEPYANEIALSTEVNDHSLGGSIKVLEDIIENYVIDYKLISMINNIYFALKEVYLSYFFYENGEYTDYDKIKDHSLKDLFSFCADFELMPYLINIDQLVIYWNLLLNADATKLTNNQNNPELIEEKKDFGAVFKFSLFSTLIVHLSIFTYNKHTHNSNSSSNTDIGKKILI